MRRTGLLLLALLSSGANAQWIDEHGVSVPDTEDRKAVGGFGAHLVLVADESTLFKQWAVPSAKIDLNAVDEVAVNEPINAFVIFTGCGPTAKGVCDVSMTLRIVQPDGTVSHETPIMEVWQNKPAPPAGALQLSARYLKFVLEPQDQRGIYTIQAQVRDSSTGAVLSLQKTFVAQDDQPPEKSAPAVQATSIDQSAQRR